MPIHTSFGTFLVYPLRLGGALTPEHEKYICGTDAFD
jgi:hypothetical protein